MYKTLLEEIQNLENHRARRAEEILRLNERMNALVHSREENSKLVARDNSNDEARMRLDNNDREIASLKSEIAALHRKMAAENRSMRRRVLEIQEKTLRALDSQLEEKHAEQDELKSTLIPEAENHVVALKERLVENQDEIQRIQKEIEEINHLDLDALSKDHEKA